MWKTLGSEEIKRVKKQGRVVDTPLFRLIFDADPSEGKKFGVLVGKRMGIAVVRNLVKRRVREIVRATEEDVPAGKLLIIPKKRILGENFRSIRNSFQQSVRNQLW